MHIRWRDALVLLAALFIGTPRANAHSGALVPVVRNATEAWKRYATAVRAFTITFTRVTRTPSQIREEDSTPLGMVVPPARPGELREQVTLTVSGDRMRLHSVGHKPGMVGPDGRLLDDVEREMCYRDNTFTLLSPKSDPDRPNASFRQATISDDPSRIVRYAGYLPIFLVFRMTDTTCQPTFGYESLQVVTPHGVAHGTSCAVVKDSRNMHVWVDNERDYVPRRIVSYYQDRTTPVIQHDVEDYKRIDGIYVPFSWSIVVNNADGSLRYGISCGVKECRLNPELSNDEFSIVIPRNTLILDDTKGTNTHISMELGNGNRIPIPLGGPTSYSEALVYAERADKRKHSQRYVWWCILAAAGIVASAVWWRRAGKARLWGN